MKNLKHLLITALLLIPIASAYAAEPADYFYTTGCPNFIEAYSCDNPVDYLIQKNPKICKTSAEMTAAYTACGDATTFTGTPKQDMLCNLTCSWKSDPNATKCASLNRSFSLTGNPHADCGGCLSGYIDLDPTAAYNCVNLQKVYESAAGQFYTESGLGPIGGGGIWALINNTSGYIY